MDEEFNFCQNALKIIEKYCIYDETVTKLVQVSLYSLVITAQVGGVLC